ncbi:hypothetical protein ASPZODRAFT_45021, partial [Penicilliopsis zonata CBS 506.65]
LLANDGADINAVGGMHGSALAGAAYSGREDVVRVLLERGADVNIRGGLFCTALHAACSEKNSSIFHLLL